EAREHDVDLFGHLVTMRERLALARSKPVVSDTGALGAESLGREARLLDLTESELRRGILDIVEVNELVVSFHRGLLRVAIEFPRITRDRRRPLGAVSVQRQCDGEAKRIMRGS